MNAKPNNLSFLHRDRGYRFTDADHLLQTLRTIIFQSQKSSLEIWESVYDRYNGAESMSIQTIENICNGKTRRPHNRTVVLIATALGYEISLIEKGG